MRIKTFLSAAALVLMSTMAFAQTITYDFDRSADFARFKRVAWVRGNELGDELNHRRVVAAVNTQLTNRGLIVTESPIGADLLVAYHAAFDQSVVVTGFSTGWGPYRFAGASGTARAEKIVKGTLAVDVMDARTRTIVWRGMATKDVDLKADPAKRERNIMRAVERIFRDYPVAK